MQALDALTFAAISNGCPALAPNRNEVTACSPHRSPGGASQPLAAPLPSIRGLVDRVISESGGADTLIHRVGYVLSGPVEDTPLSEAMQQFDANF